MIPALLLALTAVGILVMRLKTVVYDDRIDQGRLGLRTLRLDDVKHVFASDYFTTMATGMSSGLGEIKLVGTDGTVVWLSAVDVPAALRNELVGSALASAVARAERDIAAGATYRDPDKMHGLDATSLHGLRIGIRITNVSAPLSQVSVERSGRVTVRDGEPFLIGHLDGVMLELLRRGGLLAAG